MKLCKLCNKRKPEAQMESYTRNNKLYMRFRCLDCKQSIAREWIRKNPKRYKKLCKISSEKQKKSRASGAFPERWIMVDSRRSDRKRGRKNNLTAEFVKKFISRPCSYCGETKLRMTLDRIDNKKGHLMTNVVPACIRCNYARRNMPYKAWLLLVSGMRKARKRGLFGKWTGGCQKNWSISRELSSTGG